MTTDVLVIGGGLAGCVAAIQLARAGRQVTLLERERSPSHKVCGEFLSEEALQYLAELRIDLEALGAVPLEAVRLTGRGRFVENALPFPAMSLTRRCLDAELLRCAEDAGADVRRGCSVEALLRTGETWRVSLASGDEMTTPEVFLASGKHDLRGHPRPAGKQQGMVAFKMYWRLSPEQTHELGRTVELITYQGGYAGLQPVENGTANLCCLVHTDKLRSLGGKWDALLAHMCQESPHLRQRLLGAEPQLAKPLTIASLPYGFVRRRSGGLWYLGDQAVVIPSFTGDGMSLALHTGMVAAEMFLAGKTADEYQQTLAKHTQRQVAIATAVSKAIVRMPRAVIGCARFWPVAMSGIARRTRVQVTTSSHSLGSQRF